MAAFISEELQTEKMKAEKGGNGGAPAALGINGGNDSATKATTKVIKSADQLRVLKDYYSNVDPNPSREKKVELGLKLGLTPRQIQQWFCDQRRKSNKKKMEEPSLLMNLSHRHSSNGVLLPVDGEKKTTTTISGYDGSSSSCRSSNSGSGSGTRSIPIILKPRVPPSVRDDPMAAAQWEKMPTLNRHSEETLGHKRKMASVTSAAALKRVRPEDEGLGEEAHHIFRQLRRDALIRSRENEWNNKPSSQDLTHQPKQQSPMGVLPSASSSVGYAYCAETGRCFIIRRPNPAIGFPPRPVIESQQTHISARTANNPKIEPTTTEEKIMQRRLELRNIRRRERKEMQRALKQCLALLPCH